MLDFAGRYRSNGMVTNYGVLPAIDQIRAATRWIENTRNLVGSRSAPDEFSE